MASPPYNYSPSATSPPYQSNSQLPSLSINTMTGKKRASEGGSTPALKRRKASIMSTVSASSAHPLRQTSFPPDEIGTPHNARSPSVDSMSLVSGSQVSAAAPAKKKRGRKSKAEKAREQTPSAAGGRAASAVTGVSDGARGSKSATGAAGGDDEGDDAEGPTEVAITADERTKEQKAEEHRLRAMLSAALTLDQFERYELYRAAGLTKASVKRLINATVSQSVTEQVVLGVRGVAKVFIGDLVECARRVQGEWIANTGEIQTDLPRTIPLSENTPEADHERALAKLSANPDHRAPLRPEHLREALRRYKASFEGGGVGIQPVWHQQQQDGVERFPPRTGGRRLFR
ncbi:TAFII28-domain-containing protein [Thozetella sp. PMI_491]|nr:TAFII28-domain-containing protein [Thozetella sp. PMI_491]